MDASEVGTLLRRWFAGERLEVREQQDPRADVHLAVKYPPGPRGHTFTVVVPKGRDLVAVSSVTRVDAGQQDEMSALMGRGRRGVERLGSRDADAPHLKRCGLEPEHGS